MLHYKRVSLIRRDVEGGHDVEVQIQTACVFLGQTSGEHKKKKICNHLEQPLSQPPSPLTRVCVILCFYVSSGATANTVTAVQI